MRSALLRRLLHRPIVLWTAGLAMLAAAVVAWSPLESRMSRISRDFRDKAGLGEHLDAAIPGDNPWRFDGFDYHSRGIRVNLTGGEDTIPIHFLPATVERPRGRQVGRAFSLHVPTLPARNAEAFQRAAAGIGMALEAHAEGTQPWEETASPTNLPGWFYGAATALLLGLLLWLGLQSLGPLRARDRGTGTGPPRRPRRAAALLLLLFVGAYLFRLLASPHAPLHANLHGLEALDHLLHPVRSPYPSYSGRCQEGIVDFFFLFLPRSLDAYWRLAETVGAATAVAGAVAAGLLFRSAFAGGAVGVLLAVSPHLARVSTSLAPFSWACLLFPLTVASLVSYVRSRDPKLLAVGFLSGLLLVNLHLVTAPLLLLPLLVLLTAAPDERRPGIVPLTGGFLALAILSWPHLHSQWQLNVAEGLHSIWTDPAFLASPFTSQNLFFHPAASPVLRMFLTLSGLLVALALHRRAALLLLLCFPLLLLCFTVRTCFTDLVRYQALPLLLLTLFAGASVAFVVGHLSRRWILAGLLLLALGLGVEVPRTALTHFTPDVEAQQFQFLERAVPLLPRRGILVLPPRIREYRANNYFPVKLLKDAGKTFSIAYGDEFVERVSRDGWPEEDVWFFQSLYHHQVDVALQDPVLSDIPLERVGEVESRLTRWREFVSRHTTECTAWDVLRSPARMVATVPMEFNRQPDGPLPVSLCRLAQAR